MRLPACAAILTVALGIVGCGPRAESRNGPSDRDSAAKADTSPLSGIRESEDMAKTAKKDDAGLRLATFASGCFWCTEAIFESLRGVQSVVSGYSGGPGANPTYEQVSAGDTGHAEAIQVTYDPAAVSYAALLEIFWKTHDPTTPNRQGYDVGPQYRSVVFYHDEDQKSQAEGLKSRLEQERIWDRPIVTEIVPYAKFWPAEDYHQNYYEQNPEKAYCRAVITPKIEKFRKIFRDRIRPSE